MEIKPIPSHETSASIRYIDAWYDEFYCPFCGMKTIDFVAGELEAMVCPHMVFAEADGEVLYMSDSFLKEIRKLIPTADEERAYQFSSFPWPSADGNSDINVSAGSFCEIVPNSLTISTFDGLSGEDTIVSFAPVDVERSDRLKAKAKRVRRSF